VSAVRLDIQGEVDRLRKLNRETATMACGYFDAVLRAGLTPARLSDPQNGLRKDLLAVESQLREVGGSLKRLQGGARRTAAQQAIVEHKALLKVLTLRRRLLRQIADGFAWIVLRHDSRLILPLYQEQPHHLPQGPGLGGPAELARRAMESGEFLVIENDLTRCVGVGDLTVVFANRPWSRPLSLEVKSSAPEGWRVGGHLHLEVIGVHSDDPLHVELEKEFEHTLGLADLPAGVKSREKPAQTEGQLSAAKLLVAVSGAPGQWLPAMTRRVWKTVATVVSRALAEGSSYDLAERGVAFLAMRAIDDEEPADVAKDLIEKLRVAGFHESDRSATSAQLHENDEWSALVPPIALWPVGRDVRAALLCGDLVLACIVRADVWREAMRAEGLELTEEKRGWLVTGRDRGGTARLDVLEVGKLTLGVAFGGVSPQEIAANLAASLRARVSKPQEPPAPSALSDAGAPGTP
jgi:hypothetical protein